MKSIRLTPLIIIGLYLSIILSCSKENNTIRPPNIVWITSEDNSKHYLKLFDENGVSTPNIEALAKEGLVFTRAFSNAPVCSVARSTLISGSYAPRLGAQFHRKLQKIALPDSLKMFPAYLREAGYYTSNNSKEDYNFYKSDDVWDESSKEATWRNRAQGQPFFHVFNIGTTHESRLHFSQETMDTLQPNTPLDAFSVQPNHPSSELFKYTNAYYRDKIVQMDTQLGEVIEALEEDNLLEETIIFYFADHGGVLPGSKGYLYETGLHVPLVVRIPEKYKQLFKGELPGKVSGFVSFIDFGPTVLNLAGIDVPQKMDGKPFLGKTISAEELDSRNTTYAYADRFDEKYDLVRSVRKGKYKYIRNFQPFNFDGLMNNYRYKQLAFQEWRDLYDAGALNAEQAQFFETRTPEALYDLENDPYETQNLAKDPQNAQLLSILRQELNNWLLEMPDLSLFPEHYLIQEAFANPSKFGTDNINSIRKYLSIADLSLSEFSSAKDRINEALNDDDPWARYWALNTCSTFGGEASNFSGKIRAIAKTDQELINRAKAIEYLGLHQAENPVAALSDIIYAVQNGTEGLEILNSIVLLQDGNAQYQFQLDESKIAPPVLENSEAQRRLKYLGLLGGLN